jgi:hypothetical protein
MRRIHLAPIFFSVEFLNTAPPRAARVYSCSCYAAGTAAVSVLWLPAISDHMDATVPHWLSVPAIVGLGRFSACLPLPRHYGALDVSEKNT